MQEETIFKLQSSLEKYLNKSIEFYEKFDLFKVHRIKNYLNLDFSSKVVQILGTNAKGSTGRYLALMLANTGYKVGHFISPHIFSVNERFSIYDKSDKSSDIDKLIDNSHEYLQSLIKNLSENISYFEYLCFLATIIFKDCDFVILEAGVGGEYDATSVFKRDLCVFTPISIDHTDLLGENIEEITRTKIKTMKDINIFANDDEMIKNAALKKGVKAVFLKADYSKLCLDESSFLRFNFSLAQLAYFELCQHFYVEKPIKLDLKARCELIEKNILVDVGHNEAAAINLTKEIKRHFKNKVILVANFFANKDVKKILNILKEHIKEVQIIEYKSDRKLANLKEICDELNIQNTQYKFTNKSDDYVVFGSFLAVQEFLKGYNASKIL